MRTLLRNAYNKSGFSKEDTNTDWFIHRKNIREAKKLEKSKKTKGEEEEKERAIDEKSANFEEMDKLLPPNKKIMKKKPSFLLEKF